jgi:hypothetical protein
VVAALSRTCMTMYAGRAQCVVMTSHLNPSSNCGNVINPMLKADVTHMGWRYRYRYMCSLVCH